MALTPGVPAMLFDFAEGPHFFDRIEFNIITEIKYENVLIFSAIVKRKNELPNKYETLIDATRKLQWAKIAAMEAIAIEQGIANQFHDNVVPFDHIGLAQHEKAICEFISHCKSSIDSLAILLNVYFQLGHRGGRQDFRFTQFVDAVKVADSIIGSELNRLQQSKWFTDGIDDAASVVSARNEWIHRGSTYIVAFTPPLITRGYLPVPKSLSGVITGNVLSEENYYSTTQFYELHYNKLVGLINLIIERLITLENQNDDLPIIEAAFLEKKFSVFPHITSREYTGEITMRYRNEQTRPVFKLNDILEDLPQKILNKLNDTHKTTVSTIFTTLTKFYNVPGSDPFFLLDKNFVNSQLLLEDSNVNALQSIGIIGWLNINFQNGQVIIFNDKALKLTWPDNDNRLVFVFRLTQLGNELVGRVPNMGYHLHYVNHMIKLLNSAKIDVELMNIIKTDSGELNFKHISTHKSFLIS